MPDYSKGKIYTIRCKDDLSLIYVGSTVQTLSQRWTDHKSRCYNEDDKSYNILLYKTMREVGQDTFYIELYKDYPCERKEQLNKKEGEIIREIGNLNKNIAGRTDQEYRDDNKEKKKITDKLYREKNRDKMHDYFISYKEKNKAKINEYVKEHSSFIITCECGCSMRRDSIKDHQKTQKHIKLMNIQNQESN